MKAKQTISIESWDSNGPRNPIAAHIEIASAFIRDYDYWVELRSADYGYEENSLEIEIKIFALKLVWTFIQILKHKWSLNSHCVFECLFTFWLKSLAPSFKRNLHSFVSFASCTHLSRITRMNGVISLDHPVNQYTNLANKAVFAITVWWAQSGIAFHVVDI